MRLSEDSIRWLYRGIVPVFAGFLCYLTASALVLPPSPLNALEVAGLQGQFALTAVPPANPNIVLITIQPQTPKALGVPPGIDRVPRHFHAELLRALDEAGSRTALMDIAFYEPVPREDPSLVAALRTLKNLKVTLATKYQDEPEASETPRGLSGKFIPSAVWPFHATDHVALGSADNLVTHDTDLFLGGYVELFDPGRSLRLYHACITAALQYTGELNAVSNHDLKQNQFTVGSFDWKLNANQALLCQWLTKPDPFPTYEYADALRRLADPKTRGVFKDKLVLIGDVRGVDHAMTVPYGDIPGVFFMAQLLNTALLPYSASTESIGAIPLAIWCTLLSSLAFSAALTRRNLLFLCSTVFCLFASFFAPRITVPSLGESIQTLVPAIAASMGAVSGLVFSRTGLARRDFRTSGMEEEATVMFVDLRHSTQLVQEVGAARFHHLIADFQAQCSRVVRMNGGIVERTLGDGFLAVFRGADRRHHAVRALSCVSLLKKAVKQVGEKNAAKLEIAIGVESGIVSGGYVVEADQRVWASSGTAVNLAQRLQVACAELDLPVAIGPVARGLTSTLLTSHVISTVALKGFADPVEVATLEP